MQETQVQSLSGEDPLEKEIATHSSILTWKNPMDRGAWWVIVQGVAKIQTQLSTHTHRALTYYMVQSIYPNRSKERWKKEIKPLFRLNPFLRSFNTSATLHCHITL